MPNTFSFSDLYFFRHRPHSGDETDQPCSELSRHEKQLIVDSLEQHGWNQSKAARALGITRYHMRHRIKKYAIRKPDDSVGAE